MDAPTLVTLKFPKFGQEPLDPSEDPPDFVKEPATDLRETVALGGSDVKPTVMLPRMQTIANISNITGVALVGGALVQIYYSGLHPMDAWSAPAVYSFLTVMLLAVLLFYASRYGPLRTCR